MGKKLKGHLIRLSTPYGYQTSSISSGLGWADHSINAQMLGGLDPRLSQHAPTSYAPPSQKTHLPPTVNSKHVFLRLSWHRARQPSAVYNVAAAHALTLQKCASVY